MTKTEIDAIFSKHNYHIERILDSTDKLKECELETINAVSKIFQFYAEHVDDYFEGITRFEDLITSYENEFKPSITVVMEFEDNWVPDHTINLTNELKNRKVMGFYTVKIDDAKEKNVERKLIFEIDNYLNMYEPKSKLYLLFNIVAYPTSPFAIAHNFRSKNSIFPIKHINSLKNPFEETNNCSSNKKKELFENIIDIIPPNYQEINEICMGFLKIPSKETFNQNSQTNILNVILVNFIRILILLLIYLFCPFILSILKGQNR
jgi:hypothetical protein